MTRDTRIACFLMGELVAALRANDSDLFKRWLSDWAGQRGHLKPIYSPPAALPETLKPKRIGYPISDAQILHLLDNLPAGEVHDRRRFAIQLCAVCGLRPEDLRHLVIKDGVSGAELWTTYQKSMGGTKGAKTEPRRLRPLFLRDAYGSAIDWRLHARLQVGEQLPPLNRKGDGGQARNQYLRRRDVWMALRDYTKQQGKQLTLYSFRHRFAKGMHAATFPSPTSARQWGTPSRFTSRATPGSSPKRRLTSWQQSTSDL